MSWRPAWPVPRLVDAIFLVGFLGWLASGSRTLSADGDPARHLAVGEYILASGRVPHQDLFSHTMAGQPFVPYEWLAEAATAASYRLAGPAGPVALHGMAAGLAFAILFLQLRGRGQAPLLAAAVTLLAMMVSMPHWLARPHLFTLLGTAMFASVLDAWSAGRRKSPWLWALPPGMVIWANLHGGFLVGLLLISVYLAADGLQWTIAGPGAAHKARGRLVALVPVAAATLAATFLTPAGPGLLPHVIGYFGQRLLVDRTQEYLSPNFHELALWPFLAMLLGTLGSGAVSRWAPSVVEVVLLLGFTTLALHSVRNTPLFAIVVAPILGSQLQLAPALGGRASRVVASARRWMCWANLTALRVEPRLVPGLWPVAVAIAAVILASVQWRGEGTSLGIEFDATRQPVAAVAYLKAHPPEGNGFNQLAWGGYLLHQLWPAQRVFIDGQTDFYGEPLVREYLQVVELSEGWRNMLDRWRIRWVIYDTDSPLVRQLLSTPAWRVAYQDPQATVLLRLD